MKYGGAMFYWRVWVLIVGPILAVDASGHVECKTLRFTEWCPDMTTADGW